MGFVRRRGTGKGPWIKRDLPHQCKFHRIVKARQIALYPRILAGAAAAYEPHRIAFYLFDLASEFHALWTLGNASPHLRFIIQNDRQLTEARLVLVEGVATVLASGLALLGVEAPNEMR